MLAVRPNVHDLRRGIAALALFEDMLHQGTQDVGACLQQGSFPRLLRVEEFQIAVFAVMLLCQTDKVCLQFAAFFFVDAVDFLVSGICDFFAVFRELDLRDEMTVLSPDGSQLVDASEGRIVLGGDQVGAYAPGGDGGALSLQAVYEVFVKIVGGGDHRIGEPCIVQHLSGFF